MPRKTTIKPLFNPDIIADRLRAAIRDAGDMREAAAKAGISEAQLYRYCAGAPVPSDRLARLAAICGVRISWLFGEPG